MVLGVDDQQMTDVTSSTARTHTPISSVNPTDSR